MHSPPEPEHYTEELTAGRIFTGILAERYARKILICTNLNLLNSARLFYFAAATLILNIIESDPAEATLKALSMVRTQEIQESMLAHQLHATRVLHQIRIM